MAEKFNPSSENTSGETPKSKKLNFEISGTKAKTMMLLAGLSASAPALAKGNEKKDKKIITSDIPDQDNSEKEFFSEWGELTSDEVQKQMNQETEEIPSDATSTSLSLEKVSELTDIIPLGAPEVFDDERTQPWIQEVMKNGVLMVPNGGNYSFFRVDINGEERLFALTASHLYSASVQTGEIVYPSGNFFGFETNGGLVSFEGITRGDFGPSVEGSYPTDNKFKLIEITKYRGVGGELDNPGSDDWKTVRTFPLASEPMDTENPGYIGDITQSGNWGLGPDPIPNYDPELAGRFVATLNCDPTGTENPLTKMRVPPESEAEYYGKTIDVPIQIFAMDSTNESFGSSGGAKFQINDPNLSNGEIKDVNADSATTVDIVEDYRILGPIQGITHPNDHEGVLATGITLVQPYLQQIKEELAAQYGVSPADIVFPDTAYDMRVNGVGDVETIGRVVDHITSVEEIDAPIPEGYKLEQNYPNPFNPTTRIRFEIPQSEKVTLKIYNTLGQEVATLINGEEMYAGTYEETFNASEFGLASGVYIYRLTTGKTSQTQKMTFLK